MMNTQYEELIRKAYRSFNARDIDAALTTMHAEVEWPKAFEGGYVQGHEAIREYWTRQWKEIDPIVEPKAIIETAGGLLEVSVHQLVKDLEGKILFDGMVQHVYTLQDHLLKKMEIGIVVDNGKSATT